MSEARAVPGFEERREPGLGRSIALAAAVHLVLIAVLFLGLSWQSRPPDVVAVELWSAPLAPSPKPKVAPPPAPQPKVEPKPAPRIAKPDIALKEKPKPKPKPEVKPKPEPKPKPKPKPKPNPKLREEQARRQEQQQLQKQLHQELAREQAALSVAREQQLIQQQLAQATAAADAKALAAWVDKIKAKIRGNIVLPPGINGNPEAQFEVVQLPTGEVLTVTLKKSSGNGALDDAIVRAIRKSSPLPKPDDPALFHRRFTLHYWPFEDKDQ